MSAPATSTMHYVSFFLQHVRAIAHEAKLELGRLPGWVSAAHVSVGWRGDTAAMLFEEGSATPDQVVDRGGLHSDLELLFDTIAVRPVMPSRLRVHDGHGPRHCRSGTSSGGLGKPAIIMVNRSQQVVDCREFSARGTWWFGEICFQLTHEQDRSIILGFRYAPLLFYIRRDDLLAKSIDIRTSQFLRDLLIDYAVSPEAERRLSRQQRLEMFRATKQRTVIVLGAYAAPHLQELNALRDQLRHIGYDAEIISNLPDLPMESNSQKVQNWTSAARFAVMVDRAASGHLAEYELLRHQRAILALLRPQNSGSSWMIGDDEHVDVNYIRTFRFRHSPLEVVGPATEWAEGIAREREDAYNRLYPWRSSAK